MTGMSRKKAPCSLRNCDAGEDVAYVSDAGTPGISDPGYILVREAISHGIRVTPVPGASALIAALSVSGLPMDSFTFFGFLPSKAGKRRQFLTSLRDEGKTLIFYESPHRLLSSLRDIEELLGEREVVVSREITKMYEEFLRGPVGAVITELGDRVVKGEVTLIVAGRSGEAMEFSDAELLHRCEKAAAGMRRRSIPPGYRGPDCAGNRDLPEADLPSPTIPLTVSQKVHKLRYGFILPPAAPEVEGHHFLELSAEV